MADDTYGTWYEDPAGEPEDLQIDEYDITASPNDFNVLTLTSFIESGAVRIPGFQRHYVWDLKRASKLIESLILGLPVPQMFLYEQSKNAFLVIDGQQRLMSIYYFIKGRFPRREKRDALRYILEETGNLPDDVLQDDDYFEPFTLRLTDTAAGVPIRYHGLDYHSLGPAKTQFDLRPIRNIIVKRNAPSDDDSSMYEVFNRLNSGGINLTPQEIRSSMYHSAFYNMLAQANRDHRWRRLLSVETPDIHMKDVEIMLRGFAMLIDGADYRPSMVRFLNAFSKKCMSFDFHITNDLSLLFSSFLDACADLPDEALINKRNNRFNIALYEALFAAACARAHAEQRALRGRLSADQIRALGSDGKFQRAALEGTTRTANVRARLERATELISAL